jgi:hypothetical protein
MWSSRSGLPLSTGRHRRLERGRGEAQGEMMGFWETIIIVGFIMAAFIAAAIFE